MDKLSRQLKLIVISILVILGIGLYFLWPEGTKKEVAGAQIVADPNHPTEAYFGSARFTDLQSMLQELGVTVYPEDKTTTFPPPELGLGSRITITRATPVYVTDAKIAKTYRTWQQTIKQMLAENNIELLGKDSIDPTVESLITTDMKVKITRVAEVEVTQKEEIDFKTIRKNNVDLEKGQTQTEQRGAKGEKETVYIVKRVDGEEVSRTVKSSEILKEPTTEILIIGIGPKLVHTGLFQDWLNAAAKQTLVNATALQCLMMRESGGSPDTGMPDGMYKGLFQYEEGYWAAASDRAGFGAASIYDAKAQIFTTANEISRGQSRRWPPFANCKDK